MIRALTMVQVEEGERPAWWLGAAWFDVICGRVVYLPLPLNLIARWCRAGWHAVRCLGSYSVVDRAYVQGVATGHRTAYTIGYDNGYAAGTKAGSDAFAQELLRTLQQSARLPMQ